METKMGRPRSERARAAVLNAVDDLVVEVGYGGVTFATIAERAGVSRQTIYRWWTTKAEILLEATIVDARDELATAPAPDALTDLADYLEAVVTFLTRSHAGAAYRALLGEAQHDPDVARLLRQADVLGDSARVVLDRCLPDHRRDADSTAELLGPVFYWVLSGRDTGELQPRSIAGRFLRNVDSG